MLWGPHHQWECLAQEVEKAEKDQEHVSNWVGNLLDQRADVRHEIWHLAQELKQLKEAKERLQASGLGKRSGHAEQVAPCNVPQQPLPNGASAEPRAP